MDLFKHRFVLNPILLLLSSQCIPVSLVIYLFFSYFSSTCYDGVGL